jgi:hypothetical protein
VRVLVLAALAGCASVPPMHPPLADCAAPPPGGTPVDSTVIASMLPGRYEVASVTTAKGYGGGASRQVIRLERPAADSVYSRVRFRVGRQWRALVGSVVPPSDTVRDRAPVEVQARRMVIGCIDCFDASPTSYRILAWSAEGFRGTWSNPQSGIGVAIDRRGRRLPNPEGYFCARRLPD